jgi:hypothetical protein
VLIDRHPQKEGLQIDPQTGPLLRPYGQNCALKTFGFFFGRKGDLTSIRGESRARGAPAKRHRPDQ